MSALLALGRPGQEDKELEAAEKLPGAVGSGYGSFLVQLLGGSVNRAFDLKWDMCIHPLPKVQGGSQKREGKNGKAEAGELLL